MQILYTHCAGLDVHKKSVVACCVTPGPNGRPQFETRTFGTMTQDVLVLADWLSQQGVTHVALESTGQFWKPVYNILEGAFTIIVANAQHIKNVPGRKTDVKDAAGIADLLRHGLLRASFIPPLPQRDLRDLTRQRTNLVRERAEVANQLHKVLEWANLKLCVGDHRYQGRLGACHAGGDRGRRGRCGAAGRDGQRPHAVETGGAGAGVDGTGA